MASRRVGEELRKADGERRDALYQRDVLKPVAEAMGELLGEPVERIVNMGSWVMVKRLRELANLHVPDAVSSAIEQARRLRQNLKMMLTDLDDVLGAEGGQAGVGGAR